MLKVNVSIPHRKTKNKIVVYQLISIIFVSIPHRKTKNLP